MILKTRWSHQQPTTFNNLKGVSTWTTRSRNSKAESMQAVQIYKTYTLSCSKTSRPAVSVLCIELFFENQRVKASDDGILVKLYINGWQFRTECYSVSVYPLIQTGLVENHFLPAVNSGLWVLPLPVSVCVCVHAHLYPCNNPELVCNVTHRPFRLESLDLDQRYKMHWLRSLVLLFCFVLFLDREWGNWPWPLRSNLT